MIQIMVNKHIKRFYNYYYSIFIESQSGKQVIDEQAELLKYSKLKSLANILFEYVGLIVFFKLIKIEFLDQILIQYLMIDEI